MNAHYKRLLELPDAGSETFFLWGARQTGKSSLLRLSYGGAKWIDLLKADEFRRYSVNPEYLRQEAEQERVKFVVIDEVQKVPALLDEAHWLHENRGVRFALCGSSARKVKRGAANLLGGRGIKFELYGLSGHELKDDFDLKRMLNNGYLPRIYQSASPHRLLNSYVSEYLKEEIAAEGLVRSLPPFSGFLTAAAFSDGDPVNYVNIAQDVGVSREAVRGYFEILSDTLVGRFLPPYRKRPKRRLAVAAKFYFSDVGVVNFLALRRHIEPGSELFGKAFENWVFHELCCYNAYKEVYAEYSFWKLSTGVEVDFIVNQMECAIECKSSRKITDRHLKGLRELKKDHPKVGRRILVCLEPKPRRTDDGIEIFPPQSFLDQLWSGTFF